MFEYCPGCDDVIEAGEPCQCVFVARGWVDAQGVLHTATRMTLEEGHGRCVACGEIRLLLYDTVCYECEWQAQDWRGAGACELAALNRSRFESGVEPAEFPCGEFDDGRQLREPAALPEPNRWDWLTEHGGEPEDWEPVHD